MGLVVMEAGSGACYLGAEILRRAIPITEHPRTIMIMQTIKKEAEEIVTMYFLLICHSAEFDFVKLLPTCLLSNGFLHKLLVVQSYCAGNSCVCPRELCNQSLRFRTTWQLRKKRSAAIDY